MHYRTRTTISGFTLTEIMIVIGLIAVVLALGAPNIFKSRDVAQVSACIANLKTIDGAKQQWAVDKKKAGSDEPDDTDLFGTGLYVKVKPACPSGGSYSLNEVSMKPACTISGHAL
jgi:prepilin-type N-terminal cleavage/methylation domain-containing protein